MKHLRIGAVIFLSALFTLIALLYISKLIWPEKPNVKAVTIREGLTAVEISELLQSEGILKENETLPQELDGYLFPDTYEFFIPSLPEVVVKKMSDNFTKKVLPVVPEKFNLNEILTKASLIEEEVPSELDREIVAGIIEKRLAVGERLHIDSTICYIKPQPCHPITAEDLNIDSHYNTYLYRGLPPGPISNPGLGAIYAAMNPKKSEYWFYISDPKTNKTIFAKTLEEQTANIHKYLK